MMYGKPAIPKSYLRQLGTRGYRLQSKPKNPNAKARMRLKLLQSDPRCYYCGLLLTEQTATLDHALPVSKGGKTREDNCCLACFPCNQAKGDKVMVLRKRIE